MRFKSSIALENPKSQVTYMDEYRNGNHGSSDFRGRMTMAHMPVDMLATRLEGLKDNSLKVLRVVCGNPDKLWLTREIAEELKISRTPVLSHADKLEKAGLIVRKEIPSNSPRMPSSFVFQLSPDIDCCRLVELIDGRLSGGAASNTDENDFFDASSEPVPEPFLKIALDIKPSYRHAYWQTFKYVAVNQPVHASAIAREYEWPDTTANTRLDRLINLGLVGRKRLGAEKVNSYQLTQKGVELSVMSGIGDIKSEIPLLLSSRIDNGIESQPSELLPQSMNTTKELGQQTKAKKIISQQIKHLSQSMIQIHELLQAGELDLETAIDNVEQLLLESPFLSD